MSRANALLLVCLVVTVVGPTACAQAPKKCCLPEQFTALKSTLVGTTIEGVGGLALGEGQDIAIDYKNNRIGGNVTRTYFSAQPVETYRFIQDFTKKSMWVIIPDKKQCYKEPLTDPPIRCIPENATFAGTFYTADKRLYTNTWSFYLRNYQQNTGFYSVSVTSDDKCIPVGDSFVGSSKAGGINQEMVVTSAYVSYVQGISDPDRYFTLPDYCKKNSRKLSTLLEKTRL